MKSTNALRLSGAVIATGALAIALAASAPAAKAPLAPTAELPSGVFHNGQAGFVVSHIGYALSKDAAETGACPNGMTAGIGVSLEQAANNGGQVKGPVAQPAVAAARPAPAAQGQGGQGQGAGGYGRFGELGKVCQHPEEYKPDPGWRFVSGPNVPVDGIDLDGQDSTLKGKPAAGTCSHQDFAGMHGEKGVDNQFFRVVGCSKSYQSTGQSNTWETEMYTGSWGVLITLKNVHNLQNDDNVEVGIYANSDPIQLSAARAALPFTTYAMDQDPKYRAVAHGRIVNGVLTTDPVDINLHWVVNSILLDRPLQDARVKLTFTPDGGMDGILAGYSPVEAAYDFAYGFRNGRSSKGGPAPEQLKVVSSVGQAAVLGHTCNGAYYALKQAADGHRDPKTGQCTSISTQYRIHMIPAFVVDVPTKSVNSTLAEK